MSTALYNLGMETEFGHWLKDQMADRGVDQAALARAIGVDGAAINRWINRGLKPRPANCKRLAEFLGVDYSEVMRRAGHPSLDEEEGREARPLSEAVTRAARWLREIEHDYEALPVLGGASAGRGRSIDDEVLWKPKRRRRLPGNRFAVEVRGDCLSPTINDGDMIVVDPDVSRRPGQLVAVRSDGEHHVKRLVSMTDGLVLESNEGQMTMRADDTHIAGVVIAYWHEFDW